MSFPSDGQSKILSRVRALVERGERVPVADIEALFTVTDTNALARIARIARERRFGRTAFYTDVARVEVGPGDAERLTAGLDGTRSHVALFATGPLRPKELPDAARALAKGHDVSILTSAERVERAATTIGITYADVFAQLRSGAPLVIAGDGAEIFDEDLRSRFAPRAPKADVWQAVHRAAHEHGIPTIAAMTYLTAEAPAAYARHLDALRTIQDESKGFAGFVAMAVHNRHRSASFLATPTAHQTLRMIAIARIALDNIEHIAVPPALVGSEVAFVALSYGADTIDTTVTPRSVLLVELDDAATGLELTVLADHSSETVTERELVESRLVEARFVPVALDAAMSPRTESVATQ